MSFSGTGSDDNTSLSKILLWSEDVALFLLLCKLFCSNKKFWGDSAWIAGDMCVGKLFFEKVASGLEKWEDWWKKSRGGSFGVGGLAGWDLLERVKCGDNSWSAM